MSESSVTRLVLDAHGVVLNDPLPGFLDDVARETSQSPARLRRRWRRSIRPLAWTGAIDDAEIWRRLTGDELRSSSWHERLESRFEPGPAAPRLERWASSASLWLLSNHRADWLEPRLLRLDVRRQFERILVSDRIGALKPDERAFAAALEGIDDATDVLFVDDKPRNVATARRLGARAVLATPRTDWLARVERCLGLHEVRSPLGQ